MIEHLGGIPHDPNSRGYGHRFLFALTSITFGVTILAERVVAGPLRVPLKAAAAAAIVGGVIAVTRIREAVDRPGSGRCASRSTQSALSGTAMTARPPSLLISSHPFTSLDELLKEDGELASGPDEQAGMRAAAGPWDQACCSTLPPARR